MALGAWGFQLEPALGRELPPSREQSEGVFQPGPEHLPGVEILESPHPLGTLASNHVFIFRSAISF